MLWDKIRLAARSPECRYSFFGDGGKVTGYTPQKPDGSNTLWTEGTTWRIEAPNILSNGNREFIKAKQSLIGTSGDFTCGCRMMLPEPTPVGRLAYFNCGGGIFSGVGGNNGAICWGYSVVNAAGQYSPTINGWVKYTAPDGTAGQIARVACNTGTKFFETGKFGTIFGVWSMTDRQIRVYFDGALANTVNFPAGSDFVWCNASGATENLTGYDTFTCVAGGGNSAYGGNAAVANWGPVYQWGIGFDRALAAEEIKYLSTEG